MNVNAGTIGIRTMPPIPEGWAVVHEAVKEWRRLHGIEQRLGAEARNLAGQKDDYEYIDDVGQALSAGRTMPTQAQTLAQRKQIARAQWLGAQSAADQAIDSLVGILQDSKSELRAEVVADFEAARSRLEGLFEELEAAYAEWVRIESLRDWLDFFPLIQYNPGHKRTVLEGKSDRPYTSADLLAALRKTLMPPAESKPLFAIGAGV
ncbi:MAG: hypothetical protein GEU75_10400 [Dehalococcoidia bacterium]|nr:hypothetical protein [Dehalococcoidia bacterium]